MANQLPNQYTLSNLPGINPHVRRVMQDMTDRINFLTGELDRVKGIAMSASPGVDAARKETPVEGIVIIPSPAGDGFIRVNKDGVIKSYTNPIIPIGIPQNLVVNTDIANSSGVGPDTLHSYTLKAGTLRGKGDYLDIWYAGAFSVSNRDKAVQAVFDGTAYENSGVLDVDSVSGWQMINRIIRVTSTSVRTSAVTLYNVLGVSPAGTATSFALGGYIISRVSAFNVANMNTTNIIVKAQSVVAAGAAAADVVQSQSIINVTRIS